MGKNCRKDGLGDHMAGSCTPDWMSYLDQEKRVLRLTQKVLYAVEEPFFCGEHTFFKLDFCPQPVLKNEKQMFSLTCPDLKYADKGELITK